jgi:hypothetical protein
MQHRSRLRHPRRPILRHQEGNVRSSHTISSLQLSVVLAPAPKRIGYAGRAPAPKRTDAVVIGCAVVVIGCAVVLATGSRRMVAEIRDPRQTGYALSDLA